MPGKPDISIIMSVYNGETYLEATLDSILNQSFQSWELVVIDDCSKDNSLKLLEDYSKRDKRVRVFKNPENLQLPKSLNKAIGLSEGKYIARMDADDICLPNRFEKQFEFMENNPDIDLSFCRYFTLKNGEIQPAQKGRRTDADSIRAMLLVTNPVIHPGVIAKAEIMKKFLYDIEHHSAEDMELWSRMAAENVKIAAQNDYLLLYRIHDKQVTSTTLKKQFDRVSVIERTYYKKTLFDLSDEELNYLVEGIFFREKPDMKKFRSFYLKVKKANKNLKAFKPDCVDYAMFEIVMIYKRLNIPKSGLLYLLSAFNPAFLVKELFDRRKRAEADNVKSKLAMDTALRLAAVAG